ncbi:gap junction protein alpha 8 paralog a isoform X1 [Scomber scombrus]|uniref:Gap junction protein alpha 8 paralog a isoform X1 n=1 Tax=Scomber scombrus TaxID=13677 RepID=A0AAV1N6B2_SCOSC
MQLDCSAVDPVPRPYSVHWGDKDRALGGKEGRKKFTFPCRVPRERDRTQLRRSRSCGKLPPAPAPAQGEGSAPLPPQGKSLPPLAMPSLPRAKGYRLLEEEKAPPVTHLYPLAEVGMEAGRGAPPFQALEEKAEEVLPMEDISKVYDETLPSYAQTTGTVGVTLHEEEPEKVQLAEVEVVEVVKAVEAVEVVEPVEPERVEEVVDEDVEVEEAVNGEVVTPAEAGMEATDTIEDTRPLSRLSKASSRARSDDLTV